MERRTTYLATVLNEVMDDLMRPSILPPSVLLPSILISNSRQDTQSTTVLLTPVCPIFQQTHIILATHPKSQKVHSTIPGYLMAHFR